MRRRRRVYLECRRGEGMGGWWVLVLVVAYGGHTEREVYGLKCYARCTFIDVSLPVCSVICSPLSS